MSGVSYGAGRGRGGGGTYQFALDDAERRQVDDGLALDLVVLRSTQQKRLENFLSKGERRHQSLGRWHTRVTVAWVERWAGTFSAVKSPAGATFCLHHALSMHSGTCRNRSNEYMSSKLLHIAQ